MAQNNTLIQCDDPNHEPNHGMFATGTTKSVFYQTGVRVHVQTVCVQREYQFCCVRKIWNRFGYSIERNMFISNTKVQVTICNTMNFEQDPFRTFLLTLMRLKAVYYSNELTQKCEPNQGFLQMVPLLITF